MSDIPHNDISPERMREYCGDELRDVAIAFIIIDTLAVGLRFVSLRLSEKRFGIDDLLTIPGYLCCMSLNVLSLVLINAGLVGYHMDVIAATNPHLLVPWAKCLYATPPVYSAACCFPRVILLTLYLRIVHAQKPYRVACFALITFVVALGVADTLAGAFECWPVAYLWDKSIPDGHCFDIPLFYHWGTLPNVLVDLMMLILPQPVIWYLQVPAQVKFGLAATLLTGSIGMVTSIVRCVAFFTNDPLVDGTWKSVLFLKWSIIEPGVYLIAACLPCYRPLVKLVLGRGYTAVESSCKPASPVASVRRDTPVSGSNLHRSVSGGSEMDLEMRACPVRELDRGRLSDEFRLVGGGSV
ncbi:hypothetical protein P170DRAFT_411057 [Aspergillus steynii IBT 23096]|uniref:Rhodopsin domain-containing protein n=1 Tax=Aspergillus steynii IBT 23096 TaxID=1392250 RepID=A0A2I2G5Z3_9EURO|nr:uncharacterized protein P170DRAFT_411057 [Aspergillus steynii IBT 23096]PLB48302.1 hypothetical protein P170DRAFT_411057 [Aspergillus steynii IBT 23096]